MKRHPLFFFIAMMPLCTLAQADRYAAYWIRYQNQLVFSPSWNWTNEIDNRRFFRPDVQNQVIFHSLLRQKRNRWDYAAGLTLSWAYAFRPTGSVKHPTTEVRPVAEVIYEVPLKSFSLQHRIRLDNRFIEEDRFGTVFDGSAFTLRARYRIQAKIVLRDGGTQPVSLRIANEIMVNHRENLFDQNRVSATSDFPLNERWSLEGSYTHIYQQRFATDYFFQRHVFRFSVIHKVVL